MTEVEAICESNSWGHATNFGLTALERELKGACP